MGVQCKDTPFPTFCRILKELHIKWQNPTLRFASAPERRNGNINLSKYFISSSGDRTLNRLVLQSRLCPCATTGLMKILLNNNLLQILDNKCENRIYNRRVYSHMFMPLRHYGIKYFKSKNICNDIINFKISFNKIISTSVNKLGRFLLYHNFKKIL